MTSLARKQVDEEVFEGAANDQDETRSNGREFLTSVPEEGLHEQANEYELSVTVSKPVLNVILLSTGGE